MIKAFVNGQYVEKPQISCYDLGFLRGYGLFEHFRTYEKRLFFLHKRLARIRNSAQKIGIPLSYTDSEIETIIKHLIENNGFEESSIRIILTRGITDDWITPSSDSSLVILTKSFNTFPAHYYEHGIQAITSNEIRLYPEIKSLNYLGALIALQQAKSKGAKEALYCNVKGEILEGTTCNFFGIKKGKLYTASDQILMGITREIVLKIAGEEFEIELRPILLDDIAQLDEAFITSSLKEIVPIIKINDQIIGDGMPGPHTKHLLHLFRSFSSECAFQ